MKKKYIFIHDLETNKIKVISAFKKKDWIGKYNDNHFYTMFFSKNKNFVCDCPHNNYQDGLCNHRKTFLKLFLDIKPNIPIVKIEKHNIVFNFECK